MFWSYHRKPIRKSIKNNLKKFINPVSKLSKFAIILPLLSTPMISSCELFGDGGTTSIHQKDGGIDDSGSNNLPFQDKIPEHCKLESVCSHNAWKFYRLNDEDFPPRIILKDCYILGFLWEPFENTKYADDQKYGIELFNPLDYLVGVTVFSGGPQKIPENPEDLTVGKSYSIYIDDVFHYQFHVPDIYSKNFTDDDGKKHYTHEAKISVFLQACKN